MYLILLAGESGSSFWQLVLKDEKTGEEYSVIQRIWKQIQAAGLSQNTVISVSTKQSETITGLLGPVTIADEPENLSTFPSAALSCAFLKSRFHAKDDDAVCILPADLFADDSFFEALKLLPGALQQSGAQIALIGSGAAVTAGKYGFILDGRKDQDYYLASAFPRSADFSVVDSSSEGSALWSCDAYCMFLGDILAKLPIHTPVNYEALLKEVSNIPNINFEREFLDEPADLAVVPFEGMWKARETWRSMSASAEDFSQAADFQQISFEREKPVMGAASAFEGTAIFSNDDVTPEEEKVPDKKTRGDEGWGSAAILDDTNSESGRVVIRKVHVRSGQTVSSRYETRFSQTWSVIKGSAELTLGWELKFLQFGDSVQIPRNVWYSLRADEDLWMIQILTDRKSCYEIQHNGITAGTY